VVTQVLAERGKVDAELKGNTLRVYVYALKRDKVGVREVQRALGMSNPSLAQYHLNKLNDLGLVREVNGEYEVMKEVKVDVLRDFLRVGTSLIPRFVFYAVFFTILGSYMGWVFATEYSGVPIAGWLLAIVVASAAIFWYETIRAWRAMPQP
jgi:SOS-response transcriptional repressor LexA